jgi:hypothetical protein
MPCFSGHANMSLGCIEAMSVIDPHSVSHSNIDIMTKLPHGILFRTHPLTIIHWDGGTAQHKFLREMWELATLTCR